jgi:hypothetical protein
VIAAFHHESFSVSLCFLDPLDKLRSSKAGFPSTQLVAAIVDCWQHPAGQLWYLLQLPVGAKYDAGKLKNAFLELSEGRESLDRWLSNQKVHLETLANTAQVRSMDWAKTEPYQQRSIGLKLAFAV